MLKLFAKRHKRVEIQDDNILIDNLKDNIGKAIEVTTAFNLLQRTPEIKVYENDQLVRLYRMDTLHANADLTGQFLHGSVRILDNSAVMIDGIISKSAASHPAWTDKDYEAVRFQPFYLSNAEDNNEKLIGKGLFERGLHFSGIITPSNVRCICICDDCKQSFSLQHFHAGFSELQYFYSANSRETLTVPYHAIANMPVQLSKIIDLTSLYEMEGKLPKTSDGNFRYYNSFKCPHCLKPFIDFDKYKDIRPGEYYGNTLINVEPKRWADAYSGSS
ncbi:MAG TPA: hypothetical protein VNW49_05820 [Puia sp.]|nr:hypothetical protein [Puia sp.]